MRETERKLVKRTDKRKGEREEEGDRTRVAKRREREGMRETSRQVR